MAPSPVKLAAGLLLSLAFAADSVSAFYPASNPRIESTDELIPLDDYVSKSTQLSVNGAAATSYKIATKAVSVNVSNFVSSSLNFVNEKRNELIPIADYLPQHLNERDTSSSSDYCSNSQAIINDSSDVVYAIEVEVGSKNETYELVVDTGSYYIWVYGENCTDPACVTHSQFGNSNSSTIESTGSTFSITYSGDVVQGDVIIDDLKIAGFENRMKIGSVTQAGKTFESFAIDGILGLSAIDESSSFPGLINVLKDNNQIEKRIFAINLARYEDEQSNTDEGVLTIGSVDELKYTGNITYTSVVNGASLWQIPLDGLYVNDSLVELNGTRQAIVDTGTTLLIMPPSDALVVHGYIEGAVTDGVNFAVPCDTTTKLELEFSGQKWSVSPKDYIGSEYNSGEGLCISNIQGLDVVDSKWILGAVFLKNVYTVFDMDNFAIGFAEKSYNFQNISSVCSYPADKTTSISSSSFSSTKTANVLASSLSTNNSTHVFSSVDYVASTFASRTKSSSSVSTSSITDLSAKASDAQSSSSSSSPSSLFQSISIALFSVGLVMVLYA